MKDLRKVYNNLSATLFGIALGLFFWIEHYFLPDLLILLNLQDSWRGELISFLLTASALYAFIFHYPLQLFEVHLWKYFYPKYNINGDWNYSIVWHTEISHGYKKEIREQIENLMQSVEESGKLIVRQSIFELQIPEGSDILLKNSKRINDPINSITISFTSDGKLINCLEHQHRNQQYYVLDMVKVTKRNRNGLPLEMSGRFTFTPFNATFVASGDIKYLRKSPANALQDK